MTDEEVLTKAIEKALKNSWDMFGFNGKLKSWNVNPSDNSYSPWLYGRMDERDIYQLKVSLNDIIFNHDFAKAFWYKENTKPQPAINFSTSIVRAQPARLVGWQNHLQIMVVEENPIKYIERYL